MRIYLYCDSCGEETVHELVREEKMLYRCTACGMYTTHTPERELSLRAVISSGPESQKGVLKVKEYELVEKGREFIVEVAGEHRIGEVTGIELKDGRKSETGLAKDVSTVWLRDVGEVIVRLSLHKRSVTTPVKIIVDGDTEFEVGETIEIEGKKFRISRIKLIKGDILRKAGSRAKAKEIRRVYAKYETYKA
ncbi:MAG: HVO_0476 family zinc finger protein [Archaeoglobales archaeon]|nr:HVO_0476 family zinc finger protein [Archaeoglobales archaeon]